LINFVILQLSDWIDQKLPLKMTNPNILIL
jgi:hypothetical protein